jgi:hypothetical protein
MSTLSGVSPSDNGKPDDLLGDAPDPIDLSAVLDGDDDNDDLLAEGAEDVRSDAIGLGRPRRSDWIRTHPDPSHCRQVRLLEHPNRKWQFWAVADDLQNAEDLDGELVTLTAITAVNHNGDLFVWLLRRGWVQGGQNLWIESAKDAARRARTRWVKVQSGSDRYIVKVARGDFGTPDFRGWTFEEVLNRALQNRTITTADHAVLKLVRGETEGADRV